MERNDLGSSLRTRRAPANPPQALSKILSTARTATRCMSPLEIIDLGTPYHDPLSPLYPYSLRTNSTMTHTSQLSPTPRDYFTHAPRSILYTYNPNPATPSSPPESASVPVSAPAPRKPSRLLGYDQPVLNKVAVTPDRDRDRPRAPLRQTLRRVGLLCALLALAALGWRCESVGCKGRGGGGLVGDYGGDYVGGGSVVDLSQIWERPSWGEVVVDEEGEAVGIESEGGYSGELVGIDDVQLEEGAGAGAGMGEAEDREAEAKVDVEWDDELGEFVNVQSSPPPPESISDPIANTTNDDDDHHVHSSHHDSTHVSPNQKRSYPHTAQEATLIDLIAGFANVTTAPILIEGETVLATNTSSIPPQPSDSRSASAPAREGSGEGSGEGSWWRFMVGWW
ncbi:hypothetical protein SVAN01_06945 [Stagonosporopsis vannaccii]|nr:hypothetical protein SVAN01_06945 [Stagonosporopsis vannaccii]